MPHHSADLHWARIVASYGAESIAEVDDGRLIRCITRRRTGRTLCGDRVELREHAPGEGTVERIRPRDTLLERTNYRGRNRPLAANVDLLLIVIAPLPEPDLQILDGYLVLAAQLDIAAAIVLNKSDLIDAEELSLLHERLQPYSGLGYRRLETSAHTGAGLDTLWQLISGHTAILVGQSGVGKSSMVNRLVPDHQARTRTLSRVGGQGRHTTTTTTLYPVPSGGALIDSPGIRILRLGQLSETMLERGFPEIRSRSPDCRFRDCRHRNEPGCAVLAAIERGHIAASRLRSFHRLLDAGSLATGDPDRPA